MSVKVIRRLLIIIIFLSVLATVMGILYDLEGSSYTYETIRNKTVEIYGVGLYKHMTADVAIQGIAQDYVTLFIGVPMLIFLYLKIKEQGLKYRLLLTGTIFYFFLTYLFYTAMGMYNEMFLIYVILLATSLILLGGLIVGFDLNHIRAYYFNTPVIKWSGIFLMINSTMVALLWLNVVIPPLLDGSLYPDTLNHFTTLIVQGFDLGIFLPVAFLGGYLAYKGNSYGFLITGIYIIFQCYLMTALTSKLIFMANAGASVIPAIFIMPTFGIIALYLSRKLLIKAEKERTIHG